jgi:hypothetical protein
MRNASDSLVVDYDQSRKAFHIFEATIEVELESFAKSIESKAQTWISKILINQSRFSETLEPAAFTSQSLSV